MNTLTGLERILTTAPGDTVARLAADLADIAVVVDREGVVRDVPLVRAPTGMLHPDEWCGRPFADTTDFRSRVAAQHLVDALHAGVNFAGRDLLHGSIAAGLVAIHYGGTVLRQGENVILLGRALASSRSPEGLDFVGLFALGSGGPQALADILSAGGDLVLLMDDRGGCKWGNDAFHSAARTSLVTGLDGRFAEDMLTLGGDVRFSAFFDEARRKGVAGPLAARLRRDDGTQFAVTVALTRLPHNDPPLFGAIIRPEIVDLVDEITGETPSDATAHGQPQVPMKDLLRESADLVEQRCLLAALKLTGNNRSAAARALGISRQALYQKLERHGIVEG